MPEYKFGNTSRGRLAQIDDRLVCVLEAALTIVDFTILEGHRDEEKQNRMVAEGKSKLSWPKSKHNSLPCRAVDIAPYPVDWVSDEPNDKAMERFAHLAGIVRGIGKGMGVKIRWGGDWDRDGELKDNTWDDLPHIELDE